MALIVRPFPAPLESLSQELGGALAALTDTREALAGRDSPARITVVGPFPAYALDPRAFLDSGVEHAAGSGWRALAMDGDAPLALVDITFSPAGDPQHAYRDRDAAKAFAAVLALAGERVGGAKNYEVRWLSLPDVYVTALWLAGDVPLFAPTRMGSAERTAPSLLELAALQKLVKPLVAAARAPDAGQDSRFAGPPSPRSGLPD